MVALCRKHNTKLYMMTVCVLVVCALNVQAKTYYVDGQSGNDENDGQSVATAWRTIGQANSAIDAGDTVYLRAGTYKETIRPNTSGTSDSEITYARYGDEMVIITGVSDGVDLRNRHYITIDGLRIIDVGNYWVNLRGATESDSSTHNIIKNCYMDRSPAWAGIYIKWADYNQIVNNTMMGYSDNDFCGPDDLIYIYEAGSYNVIEGNYLKDAPHNTIEFQGRGPGVVRYNVVRNNSISNQYHTGLNVYTNADYTLVEWNRVYDCGEVCDMDGCPSNICGSDDDRGPNGLRDRQAGIQWGASRGIVRNNIFVNNGNALAINSYGGEVFSQYNRVFQNTFFQNYHALFSNCDGAVHSNIFKNNILSSQRQLEIRRTIGGTPNDNYYVANNISGGPIRYDPDGTVDLDYLQSTHPSMWYDNLANDPGFVDDAERDLSLASNSAMIDAGAFLTETTGAGSGTTITVSDASYFYDGWGIPGEQGDAIQLEGQSETARIVEIDYDSNRITVDKTLTWTAGQGVALPYDGGTPDLGALEYLSGSASYTLSTSATNGTITKTPEKTAYSAGETVTVEAVASSGYEFAGWSGSLSGTTNPTTVAMTSDKSITVSFTVVPTTPTYTLTTNAVNGTITKTPNQTTYDSGAVVTVEAVASSGYEFAGWSGGLSGTTNPATVAMTSDKSITASFTVVPTTPTYTLTTNAVNGTITKTPNQTTYDSGAVVTVEAVAASGYEFAGWSGSLSGTSNPATVAMTSDKSVTATFVEQAVDDEIPPEVIASSPEAGAIQVPINSLVVLHVLDEGDGVDASTVRISLDDTVIYTGDVASYESDLGVCRRKGTPADYTYTYNSIDKFDRDKTITIRVNAADLSSNVMDEYDYSFTTEMWSFGANRSISANSVTVQGLTAASQDADMTNPATTCDSSGDIWVVWHAGTTGQRDIYMSVLRFGSSGFTYPVRLTTSTADQSDPDIGVGPDDRLYVVWQDNRQGNWDIYFSTSSNGTSWSSAVRLTDSNYNQTSPAIAVDNASQCYVAYEDDEDGYEDIYSISSNNLFASKTTSQITSEASNQTDPAIAVDSSGNVYCLWTDGRSGTQDIYGATSSGGWSNVGLVTGAGNQYAPALATEAIGTRLHWVWADDSAGHNDIYYASSNGLPTGVVTGINVVDDTGDTDQIAPAMAVSDATGDELCVFVCWQDWRNATTSGGDTDLYFLQVRDGDETNVWVGDGGTGSNQGWPAIGVDLHGYPYIVWGDDRDAAADVYYAGATYWGPDVVDEQEVTASEGGTIGTTPASNTGDVSVIIPAGASPYDATVSIAKVENPRATLSSHAVSYEFAPSGLSFNNPVTITIPYAVAEFGSGGVVPCWYDSLTDSFSQDGITEIQDIALSTTSRAVRFKTSHFTAFYLVSSSAADSAGSGGGGCSLSPTDNGDVVEFLLPYAALAMAMLVLRRRDNRRYGSCKGTHRVG